MRHGLEYGEEPGGWLRPFAWILASPVVTVPITLLIIGNCNGVIDLTAHLCTGEEFVKAFTPGLVNLGVAYWLWSDYTRIRWAAGVALVFGGLRYLLPVLVLLPLAEQSTTNLPDHTLLLSLGLWLLSVVALVAFGVIDRLHTLRPTLRSQ